MKGINPCDICPGEKCDYCILNRDLSLSIGCNAYNCFLNYEGACVMRLSEDCGLRAEEAGERLPLELEDEE